MPEIGEKRTAGGETRVWTGSGWSKLTASPMGGAPMINLPPHQQSGRTDAQDSELLKQFLTTGGTIAGSAIGGPAGAVIGGAAGRTLGHIPEALNTARTGQPNTGSFFSDPAIGAAEGAGGEILPAAVGGGLKYGGKVAAWLGEKLGASPWWLRSIVGRELGGNAAGAVAAVAPPILKAGGDLAEQAGERIGTKTLSQRLQSGEWMTPKSMEPLEGAESGGFAPGASTPGRTATRVAPAKSYSPAYEPQAVDPISGRVSRGFDQSETPVNTPAQQPITRSSVPQTDVTDPNTPSTYDRVQKAMDARNTEVANKPQHNLRNPSFPPSGMGFNPASLPRDVSAMVPLEEPPAFTFQGSSTPEGRLGQGDVTPPGLTVDTRPYMNPEVTGNPIGGLAQTGAPQSMVRSRAAMLKAYTDAIENPRK